jgi:hypothetical protein
MRNYFFWGKTDVRNADVQTSAGTFPKSSNFHRSGANDNLPNGSFSDIWNYGPTQPLYVWPSTDSAFRIKAGGSVNDTILGSHARTIELIFLDNLGVQTIEVIETNGALASLSTTKTGRRFIRAKVLDVGTLGLTNDLEIIIEHVSSGVIVGTIKAGFGQSQLSMFTVRKGYEGYVKSGFIIVTGSKSANVNVWVRYGAYKVSAPFDAKHIFTEFKEVSGYVPFEFKTPRKLAELTDFWFEAEGTGAGVAITVHYDLELLKI